MKQILLLSALALIAMRPACAAAPTNATDYAAQIVASHGGPEKLLRLVKFTETFHLNGNLAKGTTRTSVLATPTLWFVEQTERVSEESKGSVARNVWLWTLAPLTHPKTKLELAADATVAGRLAHGLRLSGTMEPPVSAWFDAATHDLVRLDWRTKRFLFSHPVEVSGTRVPSHSKLYDKDDKELIRTELRDIQRLEELPAELNRVEGDTLFFTGTDKVTAAAQLLRVPSAPPRLASANGALEFEAGRDFTWQPGSRTVTLTAESRIPFKTTDELHPAANSPNAYKSQRGTDRWMFFGPGRVIHDLQCVASYASDDDWRVPLPAAAPEAQLGGLRARLRAKQPVKFVMLGDSISTEGDASALANAWPHQPGYPRLVARALETRFGGKVTLKNLSKGGMDSKWGVTRVPDVLAEKPDLFLVAFGMNDASGRRTVEEFARITKQIIDPVRAAFPECAVVLVSSMTANREWIHSAPELYPAYAKSLTQLTGPGIAFADVTTVWTAVEARKKHFDLTGNGLNHPNDFGHRLYAETILAVIGSPVNSPAGTKP